MDCSIHSKTVLVMSSMCVGEVSRVSSSLRCCLGQVFHSRCIRCWSLLSVRLWFGKVAGLAWMVVVGRAAVE